MDRKVLQKGFIFVSFFLLTFYSVSLYAQDIEDEDIDIVEEDETDIFYELEETSPSVKSVEEEAEEERGEVSQPEEDEEKEVEIPQPEESGIEEPVKKEEITAKEEVPLEEKEEIEKISVDKEPKYYTVRTWTLDRDCLWNIADRFYKNPWQWKKIWGANPFILDPDLIYPGNMLLIPGVAEEVVKKMELPPEVIEEKAPPPSAVEEEVSVSEEEEELKEVAPVEAEEITIPEAAEEISALPPPIEEEEEELILLSEVEEEKPYEYEEDTFIAPLDWEYDGTIIKAKEKKILLSAYSDFVFIDCGKDKNVVAGTKFTIYRRGKVVKHPRTRKVLGIMIKKIGVLKVGQDIQDNSATAQIVNSREPIKIGDLIKIQP